MVSFRECIIAAGKKNLLSKDKEKELLDMFDDKLEVFSKTMSEIDAKKAASNATFLAHKRIVKKKAIENAIALKKFTELKDQISKYKNNNGEIDEAEGFRSLHGKKDGPVIPTNLETRHKSVFSWIVDDLGKVMEEYANPLLRKWKRASPDKVIRELFEPGSTGNKGAEIMAKSLSESFEKARVMLAKTGVVVAKDPNWKLPNKHDVSKLSRAKKINGKYKALSPDEYYDFIKDLLDKSKMIDDKTGFTFDVLPEDEFYKAIIASYRNIMTDGLGVGKKTGLKKFAEHRFLVFKDADNWNIYNDKFGGDPIISMYEHIDMMSRAITETQIFGPKPNVVRNSLKKYLQETAFNKQNIDRKKFAGVIPRQAELARVNSTIKKADVEYDLFVGRGHLSVDQLGSRIGSNVRHFATGTLLSGSGPTVLIGDTATTFNNAAMRGWSPWKAVFNSLKEQFKGKRGRQEAAYLHLILDDLIQNNMAMSRFVDEVDSGGLAKVFSTTFLRLGGVSRFTQQARNAAGKYILSGNGLGKFVTHSMDDLIRLSKGKFNDYGKTLKMLEQYGITKTDWDIIRTTEMWNPRGNLKFIDVKAIANRADINPDEALNISFKLKDLVQMEQDFAVVVNSLRSQSKTSAIPRGTIGGELALSAFMFKSFPINIVIHNLMRAFSVPPGKLNKAKYATTLIGGMTLTGATITLMYDLMNGRDLQNVNTKEFWLQAVMRGGAFGPVGDILLGDPDAREFGLFASGPVVSLIADLLGISVGAVNTALFNENEEVNYGGRVQRIVKNWTPKPWYAKLVMQRYLFDHLSKNLDKNYHKRLRSYNKKLYQKGSGFWWKPGELAPDRLPN